ncbi:acyltransferase domain-containing protein [Chitinophaga solisilvae]|uniref:acyltransferase domain-containing protein n=1 Tax=Chitinophaga solisilvae TaxID=1233460 RepID=UPI00136CFBC4|nr:acyltransferase domain-containing protein [Chitinophaga solisilvae]
MSKVVFLFSGQGSQYFNMGAELYRANATFRRTLQWLDEEAIRVSGSSVIAQIYTDQQVKGEFDELRYTNPALFMVQYAMAKVLQEELQIHPSYVLGYSLGEMVAAAVSGIVHPLDMLGALIRQALEIKAHCGNGGMLTVLQDHRIFREQQPFSSLSLAAVNYDEHFIVAGDEPSLQQLERFLGQQDLLSVRLPVRYAFHSPMMDPVKSAFVSCFRDIHFSTPVIPFVSGTLAKRVYMTVADYYWEVIRAPVRFSEAVRQMETAGNYFYIDCSPSGTLKSILDRILSPASSSVCHATMNRFGNELKKLQLLSQQCDATWLGR